MAVLQEWQQQGVQPQQVPNLRPCFPSVAVEEAVYGVSSRFIPYCECSFMATARTLYTCGDVWLWSR